MWCLSLWNSSKIRSLCLVGCGFLSAAVGLNSQEVDDEFVNSLGMRFLAVSDSVTMCVHETRVADFIAFSTATGRTIPDPHFEQDELHPVVNVSWEDAKSFCLWLTKTERTLGLIDKSQYYRLPLEAEWENAAGMEARDMARFYVAGELIFSWGVDWPPPENAGNFSPQLRVDEFEYTSPVMSFSPNSLGFYDLCGNVWEWCEDPFEGAQDMRVLKGGSWRMYEPSRIALNRRIGNSSGLRLPTYGFRVVLVNDSQE